MLIFGGEIYFSLFVAGIASAIPATNNEKIVINSSTGQGLTLSVRGPTSDVYRRQILMSKVGKRAEKLQMSNSRGPIIHT